jgi:hypothetical protein
VFPAEGALPACPTPRNGTFCCREFAERAFVEHLQPLSNCSVGFRKAEECLMAKPRQDEALDNLNADLHFRLVFRTVDASRDDGGLVMLRQGGIGGVHLWLIAAGFGISPYMSAPSYVFQTNDDCQFDCFNPQL